ncbi:ABC transporter permease [Elstera cyanobacteriorum]|uniref:ABC transmembrane type-1 domain-containing protein n=1 Tax=Elstera cyanobacteriorum TaxID=2022747 RepID=A0A255XZQ3_9PROT|nr:ABC transporter permease subunit [Elstera cyanobacteriorum]OYQ21720.1 hypothetical protein CHR90_01055 [Elstera cyanobacteriorum]GGA01343.1 ABC transporter permease [Elstera cyanobacteriorum]
MRRWPFIALGGLLALLALLPVIVTHDPIVQDLAGALQEPSAQHWLGQDHLGRDVLARLAHGAPRSVGLAAVCIGLAAFVGTLLGMGAAWWGGWGEALIMRGIDVLLAFPGILLALLLVGLLGGGVAPLLIGLTLTQAPPFARLSRAVVAGEVLSTHVEAARLAGFGAWAIFRHHLLPPLLPLLLPQLTLGLGTTIMTIAGLGFLGLGLTPPTPEWGGMIAEALPYLTEAPWQTAAPCLGLVLVTWSVTLIGRVAFPVAGEGRL